MAKRANVAFIILFASALLITLFVAVAYLAFVFVVERDVTFGDAVAVVDIHGQIFYNTGKAAEIAGYADDANIKAVLLHINSPGGGVAASQAIYHAVAKVRETKPVVVVMGSVAASGGYYVACAADTIVAHEGTMTGSIGVIAEFLNTEELLQKVGVDVTIVKSGRYKDIGTPYREMTEAEKAYVGRLLDGVYNQFLEAVSEGRGIPIANVRRLAEGRLYTGEEALEAGLVDKIGTYQDALDLAAQMGGISGKPRVVKRHPKRPLLDRITGQSVSTLGAGREERISLKYIIP
jgi:protease-4